MIYRLKEMQGDAIPVPQLVFSKLGIAEEYNVRVALYVLATGVTDPEKICADLKLRSKMTAESALAFWAGAGLLERYEEMLCRLLPYQEDAAAGDFEHIINTLELLIRKLELRGALEAAYDQDDRIALRQIAVSMVPAAVAAVQEFEASFRRQWLDCGKVFGLEVIQRRNAGQIARLEETALRIREYLDDRISAIDEL